MGNCQQAEGNFIQKMYVMTVRSVMILVAEIVQSSEIQGINEPSLSSPPRTPWREALAVSSALIKPWNSFIELN